MVNIPSLYISLHGFMHPRWLVLGFLNHQRKNSLGDEARSSRRLLRNKSRYRGINGHLQFPCHGGRSPPYLATLIFFIIFLDGQLFPLFFSFGFKQFAERIYKKGEKRWNVSRCSPFDLGARPPCCPKCLRTTQVKTTKKWTDSWKSMFLTIGLTH